MTLSVTLKRSLLRKLLDGRAQPCQSSPTLVFVLLYLARKTKEAAVSGLYVVSRHSARRRSPNLRLQNASLTRPRQGSKSP
jgi:hypothetical protein